MAKVRSAKFETPTARLRLAIRKKPYTAARLARGTFLDYRRNKGAGTWIVRASNGHGRYWTDGIPGAVADDHEPADGRSVLSYWEASEQALALARGPVEGTDKPVTVDQALLAYGKNLEAVGGDPYNAQRPRRYLTGKLLNRSVASLGESGATELAAWRDGLLAQELAPASVKQVMICLRAALNLAAARDPIRIPTVSGWRIGLSGIPDTNRARRIVMPDADVLRLVTAAFEVDTQFGLLIAVLAAVGARLSQVARLRVADLEADRTDCRLQMPSSRKGKRRKSTSAPVPIPRSLADMLARACEGRGPNEPLLLAPDGKAWRHSRDANHQDLLRLAAERAELNPRLTTYWLRHSSIARSLLAATPIAIVAKLHDTSVKIIEAHYGKYILDSADQIARRGLLDLPAAPLQLPPPRA